MGNVTANECKPLSLLREDLVNNLVDLINTSRVPLLLVEPILESILTQVKKANLKQLEIDKANWEAKAQNDSLEGNDEN